ncbi:MAG: hypothetical protein ABFD92_16800 [Planctomycetaceae bacterium]|nr:hypothetical protein [Planctomycetaceae bacterium]
MNIMLCTTCRHLRDISRNPRTCDAFPDGIPVDVFSGERSHDVPLPNDNGIQFEEMDSSLTMHPAVEAVMGKR